jgi:hypothetical protein
MKYRSRIQKLQKILFAKDRFRGGREPFWLDLEDPVSMEFALKEINNVPHPQRKYSIRIRGEAPKHVYRALAKNILPGKEILSTLSDEDLDSFIEKYQAARLGATNVSRRKQGLPPVRVRDAEIIAGSDYNAINE